MRRSLPMLLAALSLTACDGALPLVTNTPGFPSSTLGVTLQARDLSGESWVGETSGAFSVEGDRLTFNGVKGSRLLFYRPALGTTYSLSFRERRDSVNGDFSLRWGLDPGDAPKKDADGKNRAFATGQLLFKADGSVQLKANGTTETLKKAGNTERTWTLQVDQGRVTVRSDGDVLSELDMPAGYHPAPYLVFGATVTKERPMVLDDVRVESGPVGDRFTLLRQWTLPPELGPERLTLIAASDWPNMPKPEELDSLPAILGDVVALGGYPLYRTEALIYARTDGFSGGTHGGSGIYLHPGYLKATPVAAHEMAHGYGQGGSRGQRSHEGWLVEGLADYLGHAAYHRYRGRPAWKAPPLGRVPSYDPPLAETHAATKERDGEAAVSWKVYTKGRIFMSVLAAYTSMDDVKAVIAGNLGGKLITGEKFVSALEARTGKDLAFLRPGWLVAGDYTRVKPGDALDNDKDGLLDFQEIAWGTRADAKDTDADGADDFEERAAGTDGTSAASKPGTAALGFFGSPDLTPLTDDSAQPLPDERAPEDE